MQERAPLNKDSSIIVMLALFGFTDLAEVNSVTGLRMSLDTITTTRLISDYVSCHYF